MIQRIQSLWLLLSVVFFSMEFLDFSYFAKSTVAGIAPLEDMILSNKESLVMLAGSGLSAALALIAIFLYHNRNTQILVSGLSGLAQIGLYLGFGFYILYNSGVFGSFKADFGVYFGLFGMTSNWLATRAIRKDNELVKSMDRLR
ncbi:MAG: DUF4293 domain-containing protein [Saprospiraceae bacterium]